MIDKKRIDGVMELQEWLEGISGRLMNRIDSVGDEVQKLVDEMGSVELDLKNTFNSFRCLSSVQFVENRVYEEDERESVMAETPARDSQHAFAPTESYEDEILPRYKDAVSIAWAAFQEINHQHDQASRRLRSRNKVLRNLDYDGRFHLVPHIIGTDEFARDTHCGLADLRQKRSVVDGFEIDSDTEREGADFAAELIGTGSVSEGEWSEAESDAASDQGGGFEPAVSAALDFKAMLEAALRNPSMSYDGNSSMPTEYVDGRDRDVDNLLSNVAIDNVYDSLRTTSRRMDSGDHDTRSSTSSITEAGRSSNWQLTVPQDGAVQSSGVPVGASSSSSLEPKRDEQPHRATMEELLRNPFMLKIQGSFNKGDMLSNSASNVEAEYSGLANLPFIPGGLFDDEEDDTVSVNADLSIVPDDSNTEPTIPEGLFQREPTVTATEQRKVEPHISNPVDSQVSRSPKRMPTSTSVRQSSNVDVGTMFQGLERKAPQKVDISDSSSILGIAGNTSTKSSLSNGSKGQATPQRAVIPIQIRGGLFDDSDDDDEDSGDLFGISDAGVDTQPRLRSWASISSKGLFDDLDDPLVQPELIPQPSEAASKLQTSDSASPLLRQFYNQGKSDVQVPSRYQPISNLPGSTSDRSGNYPPGSSLSRSTVDLKQNQSSNSSMSRSIPDRFQTQFSISSQSASTTGPIQKQPSSSGPSRNAFDPLKKESSLSSLSESPEYSFSSTIGSLPNRNQERFAGSSLSGSTADGMPKQASGSQLPSIADRKTMDTVTVITKTGEVDEKGKDDAPHANLESLLAAGIRPTVHSTVNFSDDSDSWSSSETDGDGVNSSRGKLDALESFKESVISTDSFGVTDGRDTTLEVMEEKAAPQFTRQLDRSSSVEDTFMLHVAEEVQRSPTSSQQSLDFSSTSSPSRPERSVSGAQVMEMPDNRSVTSQSPEQQPIKTKTPAGKQTVVAENPSETDGEGKLVHTTLSRSLGPPRRRAPTPTHALKTTQSLPVQNPPRSNKTPPRNLSHDALAGSDLNAPVKDVGRLSSGRTFTSLFDEDDGEEDLFGTELPKKTSVFTVGSVRPERESTFDFSSDFQTRGRDEAMNADVAPEAMKPLPAPSKVPVSSSPVKQPDKKVIDGDLPSGNSTAKLSSLLFGDDDEDNEDALFGPLREKSSRGSNDWLASTSSFSPAKITSARRTSESSLFDD